MAEGNRVSWGAELVKIRRFLRDPDGTIWSDEFLRHLWNDTQQDLQHKTGLLADVAAQRIPGLYQFAYQFDWEYRSLPEGLRFYQCLAYHDDYVISHRWEAQEITGIDADIAEEGIHFTHPWEAFMGEGPGEVVKMPFPRNFGSMKFIAYDEMPIDAMSQKQVQSTDASYVTHVGEPVAYYPCDGAANQYVLYPRPSVSFVNELSGEGAALYAEGDTEDVTTGTIAVRTGSSDGGEGAALDIIGIVNNVFMVYEVTPSDMLAMADESDFPKFIQKYVRFGVVSRAYGANTDGRIKSLAELWTLRYELGVKFVRKYMRLKRQDRDYRLTTRGAVERRLSRHPRLPDTYPAI